MDAGGAGQKPGWARQHFWREEEVEDGCAEYRFSMPELGKIDLLWRPACCGGRALPPALGRIIYFSNSGREEAGSAQPPPVRRLGRSAEARALGSETAGRLRGSGPGTHWRAVVMLAVSLKWRLGVVRRRPKGTEQRLLWGAEGATGGGSLSTRGPPVSWLAFVWVPGVSLWHSSWGLESGSLLQAPVSCSFLLHPSLGPHLPVFWVPSSLSTPAQRSLSGPLGVSPSPWSSSLP